MRALVKHSLITFWHWVFRQPRWFIFMLAFQVLATLLVVFSNPGRHPATHFLLMFYVWFFPFIWYGIWRNHVNARTRREQMMEEQKQFEAEWRKRQERWNQENDQWWGGGDDD